MDAVKIALAENDVLKCGYALCESVNKSSEKA
jgi:hypothetical protein